MSRTLKGRKRVACKFFQTIEEQIILQKNFEKKANEILRGYQRYMRSVSPCYPGAICYLSGY